MKELQSILSRIDGKGYKAYKDLQGKSFSLADFDLIVHYAQGDPFASPSRIALRIPQEKAQFSPATFNPEIRRKALCDYITRTLARVINQVARGNRGTGKSGLITVDKPGQEILERTSVVINSDYIEARIFVGLPARGRKILGRQAAEMLLEELPEIVKKTLYFSALNPNHLIKHIKTAQDQEHMRQELEEKGLIAFIANGAILPRKSGVDERPMDKKKAIPFQSPPELEIELNPPHYGPVKGMGIPQGVTLIVGGGYHGKSTLLRALERSVYNHVPGDGREQVVTRARAMKIKAEDGRRVEKVNIAPFISNLPFQEDTRAFSSEDSSGSTSQAANIIEAIEAGAETFLIDEDTSATNFMIRDYRMQKLVARDREPITPFIDKVRQLFNDLNISTILVLGGSGDYFDVADKVIMMNQYLPRDVTREAKGIARQHKSHRVSEGGEHFGKLTQRVPLPASLNPRKGQKVKIKARGDESIQFGYENIDLKGVEQIVHDSQTRAIGDLIFYALREKIIDGSRSLPEITEKLNNLLDEKGLEIISPHAGKPPGNYARPRSLEIAAALNRLRTLKVKVVE